MLKSMSCIKVELASSCTDRDGELVQAMTVPTEQCSPSRLETNEGDVQRQNLTPMQCRFMDCNLHMWTLIL